MRIDVAPAPAAPDSAYDAVVLALASGRGVLLDGGDATRTSVRAGSDVVRVALADSPDWIALARRGVREARAAIAAERRTGEVAVALAFGPEIEGRDGRETVRLAMRALAADPPDLLLAEGLSVVRPSLFEAVDALVDTGLPVWLSFGRCRHGLCGGRGQHWGGPEGDAFGRAAARFELRGVGALLIGGIPLEHADGMAAYLRDFTDLPLGVLPRAGDAAELARGVQRWRLEGAQIFGGDGPKQVAAAGEALSRPPARRARRAPEPAPAPELEPWIDGRGRALYPLPFPDLAGQGDVFVPSQGSYMIWRHLFRERLGRGKRCLDIGCGGGLQSIQLALNGAERAHGIDLDPDAVELTLTNAFRNGVADRVTAESADLYEWEPDQRYDVVIASLYQTPVDPHDTAERPRPADFWGRNAVDHVLSLLPRTLADGGAAYVLHLSILSQRHTAERLARHGLVARVVDYAFMSWSGQHHVSEAQIARVERLSDAHHLRVAGDDVMIGYLLEVASAEASSPREPIRSLR